MRRHLVRKSTKGQIVHIGKDHKEPTTRTRKQDRTPHEVKRYRTLFSPSCIFIFSAHAQGFDEFLDVYSSMRSLSVIQLN